MQIGSAENGELFIRYAETKDESIRNKIILEYLPLIKRAANKVYRTIRAEQEFEDLVHYGIFGLIKALEKFEINRNLKFSTFAYQKIYFGIIDELRKIDHVPRMTRDKIRNVQGTVWELENKHGHSCDHNQIAYEHGLSALDINVMNGNYMLSANELVDYLQDQRGIKYDDFFCRHSFRQQDLSFFDG
jgi:RNA polymerase sigma factor for flagellar operon FliA